MKLNKEFLKEYINTPSPVGYEMLLGGQRKWMEYVKPFTDLIETDAYGNVYAHYYSTDPKAKTILLDAHADEIGFTVFDITSSGFLKVARLGGSDISITPSSRVDIWGEHGLVKGVFGHPAIHVQEKQFKPDLDKIFIDIGCSTKKQVLKKGIVVGTPITMSDGFMELGKYYCGRSLDDKIGGFITAELLRKLRENDVKLPINLVVVNAVQEETGLHGAKMAGRYIKPDLAIAIDVCHDTTSPAYSVEKSGTVKAGDGIVLMNAPSIQKNVMKLLIDTAKDNKIPYQLIVSGGSSGTNADSYAYPHGIPTGLLNLAMRYMHTTVEMVHKKDVNFAIELLYNLVQNDKITKNLKYK